MKFNVHVDDDDYDDDDDDWHVKGVSISIRHTGRECLLTVKSIMMSFTSPDRLQFFGCWEKGLINSNLYTC